MEKIVVGTLVLILDMQFLSYTKDIVQHSPSHTPLIGMYTKLTGFLTTKH